MAGTALPARIHRTGRGTLCLEEPLIDLTKQYKVALYDNWGRLLRDGFDNKTDAFTWLINHLPWRVIPEAGGKEYARCATEYEAELVVRNTAGMVKEQCDIRDYRAYYQMPRKAHGIENSIH